MIFEELLQLLERVLCIYWMLSRQKIDQDMDLNDSSQTTLTSNVESKNLYLTRGKEKKQKKDTAIHDESAYVLRTINNHLQEKSANRSEPVQKSNDEMFGIMVFLNILC